VSDTEREAETEADDQDHSAAFMARTAEQAEHEAREAVEQNRLAHENPDPPIEDDPLRGVLAAQKAWRRKLKHRRPRYR
jgi:hypothetical protein